MIARLLSVLQHRMLVRSFRRGVIGDDESVFFLGDGRHVRYVLGSRCLDFYFEASADEVWVDLSSEYRWHPYVFHPWIEAARQAKDGDLATPDEVRGVSQKVFRKIQQRYPGAKVVAWQRTR